MQNLRLVDTSREGQVYVSQDVSQTTSARDKNFLMTMAIHNSDTLSAWTSAAPLQLRGSEQREDPVANDAHEKLLADILRRIYRRFSSASPAKRRLTFGNTRER